MPFHSGRLYGMPQLCQTATLHDAFEREIDGYPSPDVYVPPQEQTIDELVDALESEREKNRELTHALEHALKKNSELETRYAYFTGETDRILGERHGATPHDPSSNQLQEALSTIAELEEEIKREKRKHVKLEFEKAGQLDEATKTLEAFKKKKEHEELLKKSENLKENISEMKREQETIGKELNKFRKKEFVLKSATEAISKQVEELKNQIKGIEGAIKKLSINSIKISNEPEATIPILSHEDIENLGTKTIASQMSQLEQSIKSIEAELSEMRPNLKVIEEYRQRETIYLRQKEEYEELEGLRDEKRISFESLRKLRYDEFLNGFRQISLRLKELYQLITMGGNAELELVDSLDPFTEGILFSVMPPKKSWKNISNLSGGEKTLSSLALVFALHTFKPTPIYVMDEIDAALDFRNVSIVANYLKERTRDAQFIVISLRNNMFEMADRLVGIYKTNQKTRSVTIDPKTFCIKTQ